MLRWIKYSNLDPFYNFNFVFNSVPRMFFCLDSVFLAVHYGILLCLAYYRTEKHIIGSTTVMLDKCMNTRTCMNRRQPEASIIGKYKPYICFNRKILTVHFIPVIFVWVGRFSPKLSQLTQPSGLTWVISPCLSRPIESAAILADTEADV